MVSPRLRRHTTNGDHDEDMSFCLIQISCALYRSRLSRWLLRLLTSRKNVYAYGIWTTPTKVHILTIYFRGPTHRVDDCQNAQMRAAANISMEKKESSYISKAH